MALVFMPTHMSHAHDPRTWPMHSPALTPRGSALSLNSSPSPLLVRVGPEVVSSWPCSHPGELNVLSENHADLRVQTAHAPGNAATGHQGFM